MQNVLKVHLSESSISPSVIDFRVCSRMTYDQVGNFVMLWKSVAAGPRGPFHWGRSVPE